MQSFLILLFTCIFLNLSLRTLFNIETSAAVVTQTFPLLPLFYTKKTLHLQQMFKKVSEITHEVVSSLSFSTFLDFFWKNIPEETTMVRSVVATLHRTLYLKWAKVFHSTCFCTNGLKLLCTGLVIQCLMECIWCVCWHRAQSADASHTPLMEAQEARGEIKIWHLLNGRAT